MDLSPNFITDTTTLLQKSFETHEASYRDLIARAAIDHTLFKSRHIQTSEPVGILAEDDRPICIIGSGVAGLYAAMILQDLGLEYEVLEASDHIGGRIMTHRFNGEAGYDALPNTPERYDYYDVGGMRFPETPFMDRVFDLFKRIGVQDLLVPHVFHHQNNLLYYNLQPPATAEMIVQMNDYFHVSASNEGAVPDSYARVHQPDYWISKVYDPYKCLLHGMDDRDAHKRGCIFRKAWVELMKQDHFSIRGYLLAGIEGKPNSSPDCYYPEAVVHWLETMSGSTGLYDQAFVDSVIDFLDFDWPFPSKKLFRVQNDEKRTDPTWFIIDGGTDHVVREMAKKLEAKPKLNHTVTGIEQVDEAYMQVTFRDSNGEMQIRGYSQVISTVSLGCLQTIDTVNAGLSYRQREAIRAVQYQEATKIGIKFEKRWWEDPAVMGKDRIIRGGQSTTDLPIRVCVYPSYGLSCPTAPGVLLASYTWAQDARRFGSITQGYNSAVVDQDALEIILSNLEKLHGVPRKKFGPVLDHHVHAWYNDKYTRGAFSLFSPGHFGTANNRSSVFASLKAPAARGRFHIAGEATSVHHAWVLGALNSAWRAVYNLLLNQRPEKIRDLKERWGMPDEESEKALRRMSALARHQAQ